MLEMLAQAAPEVVHWKTTAGIIGGSFVACFFAAVKVANVFRNGRNNKTKGKGNEEVVKLGLPNGMSVTLCREHATLLADQGARIDGLTRQVDRLDESTKAGLDRVHVRLDGLPGEIVKLVKGMDG